MANVSLSSSTNSSDPDIEECHHLQGLVWHKTYLTEHTYRHLVVLICVNSLAVVFTILLNALVIFVVTTRRRLQTNSNILLACLAGTDLLVGLTVQPIGIAGLAKRAFGIQPFCTVETVFAIALFASWYASLSHLVLISIDRYIAVKDALRYREIVTRQRIKKAVLVAWAIAVFFVSQEIILAVIESGTKIYSVYWILTCVIAVIFGLVYIAGICYCYGYIFSETRRQKKRLQTEQLPQEEAKRIKKDNKAAHTLALILGVLIATYFPTLILVLLATFSFVKLNPWDRTIFFLWTSTSILLGSVFNPIIYCWRNKKLRRAFLEIFHVRQPENRAPDIEMVEIQRHRPEIQPSACEAFSMAAVNQEPVLLSFSNLNPDEIVHIEEMDN
ncbi:trace amine-associated receptor 2-like [Oculina patagonica]